MDSTEPSHRGSRRWLRAPVGRLFSLGAWSKLNDQRAAPTERRPGKARRGFFTQRTLGSGDAVRLVGLHAGRRAWEESQNTSLHESSQACVLALIPRAPRPRPVERLSASRLSHGCLCSSAFLCVRSSLRPPLPSRRCEVIHVTVLRSPIE